MRTLTRSNLVRLIAVLTILSLAACAAPTPQVITEKVEVTRVVEVEGTPKVETVVQEVVVTATPGPTAAPEQVQMMGFPRSETVFAQQLTGRNATPSNFNYWAGWRQQDRGMQQVMNEPLWVDDFEAGKVIDALAAGPAQYSDDFKTLTIKLREGMMWSDGVEITADDLAFTVDFVKQVPTANSSASVSRQVESVKATDKYTVEIQLKEPNPRFHLENFTDLWGSLWVMPKHIYEQFVVDGKVDAEKFNAFEFNPPISSGPYKLHSFDPAGYWTAWEKREDWAKTPTGAIFGEPKPKYVVFTDYGDFTARIIAMTRHEVDMIDLDLPAIRAVTKADPSARGYFAERGWPYIQSNRHPGVGGVVFNTLKAPFDNPDVRWALQLAIDPVSYDMTAYDGAAAMNPLPIVINGPQMQEPYVKPLLQWLENDFTLDLGNGETIKPWDPTAPTRLVEEAVKRGFEFPNDPKAIQEAFGYGAWKYDLEASAKLLKKAGFTQDADGKWLLPDGTPFAFTVYTQDTPGRWSYQNAQAAYTEWKRAGFDVNFEVGDPGQQRIAMGQFDVAGTQTHGANYLENADLFRTFTAFNSQYLEKELGKQQFGHPSRWTNPRVDEILKEIQGSNPTDMAKLQPIGLEMLKLYIQNQPAISATTSLDPYAVSQYYWTGWPSAENHFTVPYHHYPNFKYLLTFIQPTGK
jgi:peptide/nickel transport system substrate-binding protein